MRIQSLAVLSFIGFAAAGFLQVENFPAKQIQKNKLGAMEIVDYFEDGSATTVIVPHPDLLQDYERQAHTLAQASQQIEVNKERIATDDIAKCDNRFLSNDTHQAGYFFPVYVGSLNEAE